MAVDMVGKPIIKSQAALGARLPVERRMAPAALIAGAVTVLALPSAVLAFSARLDLPPEPFDRADSQRFAPGALDPRLARTMSSHGGKGPLFRFTPAGLVMRPDRAVTVAVRVDAETAREIIVHGMIDSATHATGTATSAIPSLRIAPTAYNLGVSHGYQMFAQGQQDLVQPVGIAGNLRKIDMPDLSTYQSGERSGPGTAPRLAAHIALDEHERAGRAPRTLESVGMQTVDLGGSYRLSRNIDVTAGVRYSRDGDRLQPVTDGKADSQAVFVGTQFRF